MVCFGIDKNAQNIRSQGEVICKIYLCRKGCSKLCKYKRKKYKSDLIKKIR